MGKVIDEANASALWADQVTAVGLDASATAQPETIAATLAFWNDLVEDEPDDSLKPARL